MYGQVATSLDILHLALKIKYTGRRSIREPYIIVYNII